MAYRTFVDSDGVTWQVWEVRPTTVERRAGDRRTSKDSADYAGPERRTGAQRRTHNEQRVSLGPELSRGWLAFQSSSGRRRLAPVPDEWITSNTIELAELCARAQQVSYFARPGIDDQRANGH